MSFFPEIRLTWINGFLLMLPLFLIRFSIPSLINKQSLPKLQYFPEVLGTEKPALKIYFITNNFIIFSPLIFPIEHKVDAFIYGLAIYGIGIIFMLLSIIQFSRDNGFTKNGIYKLSRNPMYIGYFGTFLGTSIMIGSILHIIITLIYQVSTHYLILSEERWCKQQFGEEYIEYLETVPRYLLFF